MERLERLIDIKPGQKAFIVGMTGSGKSILTQSLVSHYPNVLVINEKGDFYLPHAIYVRGIVELPAALDEQRNSPLEPIIYKPDPDYWNFEDYNEVYRLVYLRQKMTIVTDEVYEVMKGTYFPRWYQAVLTRGRALNIRSINESQRPSWIPKSVITEAQHYACFYLAIPDDRRAMAEVMGEENYEKVMQGTSTEHSFFYYNVLKRTFGEYELEERSVSRIQLRTADESNPLLVS